MFLKRKHNIIVQNTTGSHNIKNTEYQNTQRNAQSFFKNKHNTIEQNSNRIITYQKAPNTKSHKSNTQSLVFKKMNNKIKQTNAQNHKTLTTQNTKSL